MTHSMGKPGLLLDLRCWCSVPDVPDDLPVIIFSVRGIGGYPKAKRVIRSIFEEGCTEYTGYFASGSLNRLGCVENVRRVISTAPLSIVNFDRCTDAEEVEFSRPCARQPFGPCVT